MSTAIIVQARMTSTRLPGKVLKQILGKSLLEFLVERLHRVRQVDEIIIATTTNSNDDVIVEKCKRLGVSVTRGSEHDVLARYYDAAVAHGVNRVVRVTSDCPLIDPQIIDRVIAFHADSDSTYDYVSNTLHQSFPYGMAVEVFPFRSLEVAFREAVIEPEREHVSPFIYTRPERFRLGQVVDGKDNSHHRWTVDTVEDFELVRLITEALYPIKPNFDMQDVLKLLDKNPHWVLINAHVQQKKLGE